MDTNTTIALIVLLALAFEVIPVVLEYFSSRQKTRKGYTVWVGGVEVNDHYFTREEDARCLAQRFIDDGYDDVQIEMVTFPVD